MTFEPAHLVKTKMSQPQPRRGPPPPESELVFAQRKLEELYSKTYRRLIEWQAALEVIQEVLVWRKPVPAIALYLAVHGLFFYLATTRENALHQLSTLLFWLLVGDAIWRAATRDGQGLDAPSTGTRSRSWRRRVRRKEPSVVSFERAILMENQERGSRQLLPFEVVCLSIARWWMWLDNLWLALRHWSVHEPIIFCMVLAVPGVVLSVVGKYIPTIVLLYIIVMSAIVWPYIWYHNLLQRTINFCTTHFPVLIQRGKSLWEFLKTLLSRDEREISELSLSLNRDERETQEVLHDELERAISNPGEDQEEEEEEEEEVEEAGTGRGREDGRGRRRERVRGEGEVARGGGGGARLNVRRMDPGMSVLQDSVLGMSPNAFHDVEDSLASFGPGSGDFPSISNLDQSLTLPQFPPEHSPLPSAPPLTTIEESQEDILDDLDPLTDSVELEFGIETTDGRKGLRYRSKPARQQMPHPLAQYSVSAPTTGYTPQPQDEIGRRSPPPSYDVAVAQDTPISYGTSYIYPDLSKDPYYQQTVPRSSSTPSVDGRQ